MKEAKEVTKILVSIPCSLLKEIDKLAKESKQDRSAFICSKLEAQFYADECRKAAYAEAAKTTKTR
jgi:metal-responsive CopG/Arc/MetJ family transcriptional regulator